MKYHQILLLMLFFILSNCSSQTSNDLYSNLEKKYPSARYLAAVGMGDSKAEAEKKAMAKLALIFESNIDVSQTLNEKYDEFSDDETSTLTYEAETKKRTNIASNQKLLNIKFADYTTDDLGNNYVVAYIKRNETANIYDEKIENLHTSIKALWERAGSEQKNITKYAILNYASKLINENMQLMKQQSIISPINPDFSDKISLYDKVYAYRGEVAGKLHFKLSEKTDEDVKNTLLAILTSKGFKIDNNGNFKINAVLHYEEVDLGRKEYFYNWFMNIELKNENNEIIFNYEKTGREGGISKSACYQRAKYEANKSLRKEFVLGFEKYLNSLVGK